VARDLGLWGIATNLPNVVAPLVGGWILSSLGGTRLGYQTIFALAGVCFALGSLSVLLVGTTPRPVLTVRPDSPPSLRR
jgi:MFS family permease